MKIIYAYAKSGMEAAIWQRELSSFVHPDCEIIPLNFAGKIDTSSIIRAQLLDNLYYEKNQCLLDLYQATVDLLRLSKADVLLVDTCPPYHPEFLRKVDVYKVLRITDGPMSSYDRDFAYLHAYDHILYHSRAYSEELEMPEKLKYCRARRFDFWPLALFDSMHDSLKTPENILHHERDIDIIFIGALWKNKMPLLAQVQKHFRKKAHFFGKASLRKNIFYNLKFAFPGIFHEVSIPEYVRLYQRSKLGINIHNRGKYTTGNYRLFDLPGNGVMQISDGAEYINDFFLPGTEIESFSDGYEFIEKAEYFLSQTQKRHEISLNGFARVKKDHTLHNRLSQLYELLL